MPIRRMPGFTWVWSLVGLLAFGCGRTGSSSPDPAERSGPAKVRVAFVTNNASDFWQIARAGVKKAEIEFHAGCDFRMPPEGTAADQQRIVETLIAQGIQGMAISPNDAENQVELINRACKSMHVITHDSDAPQSNRRCYVGTNNYTAGREAGKLIKEVLPSGGTLFIFVGRMDAQNAIERRQGIIDELRGSAQPGKDPASGRIEAGKWIVLDTRTDLTDRPRAKQNVEDALTRFPDVGCLVGLWSYNGPAIVSAVKDSRKEGKVPIVCFDEEEDTLQAVADGVIYATVVQQPYEFGYRSVKILASLARGDESVVPPAGIEDVPVKIIRKDNVREFWENLKRLKAGG
jgi:ribose transport system substrate-binding protein